jgi:hypothetical protein
MRDCPIFPNYKRSKRGASTGYFDQLQIAPRRPAVLFPRFASQGSRAPERVWMCGPPIDSDRHARAVFKPASRVSSSPTTTAPFPKSSASDQRRAQNVLDIARGI